MDTSSPRLARLRPRRGTIDWTLLWQSGAFAALVSAIVVVLAHVQW